MSSHEHRPIGSRPPLDAEAVGRTVPAVFRGLTFRALLVALLVTVLNYTTRITYVVPPVSAIFLLLILQGLNAALSRVNKVTTLPALLQPFSLAELLVIYMSVAAALSMGSGANILHYLMFPQYYSATTENWGSFFQLYPSYYVPHDAQVIKGYFQSSPTGAVPWGAWLIPVAWWSAFNLLLVFALLCLVGLFRRQWVEAERLTYPLLFLPLEITGGLHAGRSTTGFFRNPITWIGIGVAALYNGINILHAIFPAFPGIAQWTPLLEGSEGVLKFAAPLNWTWNLDVIGLGFLTSGEVLFSTWFFYFFIKIAGIVGMLAGYREAGFPFYKEISGGACIAYVGAMIYAARPHLRRVFRRVLAGPGEYDRDEAMSYRLMVLGLAASMGVVIWMLARSGLTVRDAGAYFTSLFIFVLVAAKIRAEAGPPLAWTHPWGYTTLMPLQLLGSRWLRGSGPITSLVMFHSLEYIGRTTFAMTTAQSFTDGLKLADFASLRRSSMAKAMIIVCIAGILLGFWQALSTNYQEGHEFITAKGGGFSWGNDISRVQYRMLGQEAVEPSGPDWTRVGFYAVGLALGLLVIWGRMMMPNFPFHPAGFILATSYGASTTRWGNFLLSWIFQRLILHYAGQPGYRRAIPGFLGMALSHILIGPVIWRSIAGHFLDRALIARYSVGVGGG